MASIKFKDIFLNESSTISSHNEKIDTKFTMEDFFDGENTSEDAEVKMQTAVLKDITKKQKIDFLISGELSNQLGISNRTLAKFGIPYMGVYNACASFPEAMIIAASILSSSTLKNAAVLTSSHNLSVERTFRYPIEYGAPRKITQLFTATGAVASTISKTKSNVKLESATLGRIIDYGLKDANNMGAIMAPAAASTLQEHLKEMKRTVSYYDIILTGDLGKLGTELFKEILSKNDITLKNHIDAGSNLITDRTLTDQGASGPVCLPLYLIEKILKEKKYKKILIIGTGSLQNQTLVNQKNTIPAIAHTVSLEVE
ncbi:MAG TPA: stage V sporulation protein AD [Firmicutes bacterium]|nr:stage V sporulation protein AD [Bacillota bacterium]